jgi:hypothetical protein
MTNQFEMIGRFEFGLCIMLIYSNGPMVQIITISNGRASYVTVSTVAVALKMINKALRQELKRQEKLNHD